MLIFHWMLTDFGQILDCKSDDHICKYASMKVCKYASTHIYVSMHIYASMQVCKYTSMHIYASMRVCKYASMQVWQEQQCVKSVGQICFLNDHTWFVRF